MTQLSRPARRGFLIAHVVASVGWLGLTLCLLVLAATGATTDSAPTAEAAYRAMKIFGDWLLAPLAVTTLVTGLVLSLGTVWGLARHRWVLVKFWITLGAAIASMLAFRTTINEAAAAVAAGDPVTDPAALVAPPIVSLSLYLFNTAISYLKPWGLTRRGRRLRAARVVRKSAGSGKTLAAATHRQPV
ncbi:DUF2269 domain-containing protein [Streptomyces sp. 6N223]|uniref:DUF2269 domain-containing protein n=1 Tax=Streptomyces sp. 6N223 TaxID=3457412 RepID=UPI003FD24E5E